MRTGSLLIPAEVGIPRFVDEVRRRAGFGLATRGEGRTTGDERLGEVGFPLYGPLLLLCAALAPVGVPGPKG